MRYLDVCAGISASTVAWKPLGWKAAAYSEIEAAPRAVLAHHYPDTPLHGDFTTIRGDEYGPIDLLVGGTPCQDFSVAGLRAGLDGDRGNLSLEFLRLADRARPRWVVWENVPGVLSIDGGRAFGAILGGLGELGYGFAYRILDAQFFGVPQRRRRVFVVGCAGDWRRAAAVLSERHSLSGHPAPRREARQIAPTIPSRSLGGGGLGTDFDCDGGLILEAFGGGTTSGAIDIATAQTAHGMRLDFDTETFVTHSLRGEGYDASEDGTGRGTPLIPVSWGIASDALDRTGEGAGGTPGERAGLGIAEELAQTIAAKRPGAVAFAIQERAVSENLEAGPQGKGYQPDTAYTLEARHHVQAVAFMENQQGAVWEADTFQALNRGGGKPGKSYPAIRQASAVRRLTPRECERLQGFPDDYTLVPHRGKPMADGPRYKALGNSMAVPVMRWIGERIAAVEALVSERHAA